MRKSGVVKFYLDQKGYGFITSGEQDIFVHVKQLPAGVKRLSAGQKVTFIERPGKKGNEAQEVYLVLGNDSQPAR